MKTFTIAVSLLISVGFIVPVQSEHGCNGTVTQIEVHDETLYIDDRSSLSGDDTDLWFYLESNDIEGLQSGGEIDRFPGDWEPVLISDGCDHRPQDLLII